MSLVFREPNRKNGDPFAAVGVLVVSGGLVGPFCGGVPGSEGIREASVGDGGKQAHFLWLLVALLFYSCATGISSSRKLEAVTHDSVAVRYITGNLHPDPDRIAYFRKRHLAVWANLFHPQGDEPDVRRTWGSTRPGCGWRSRGS